MFGKNGSVRILRGVNLHHWLLAVEEPEVGSSLTQAPGAWARTRDQKCHGLSRCGGRQGFGNPWRQELDFFWQKSGGDSFSCHRLLVVLQVFLDLHTAQDAGDEGWFQIDRMTGLN